MTISLDADHILLGQAYSTKQEVIQTIGEIMVAHGEVTRRYVEGMLQKEAILSTWVTEGVALPHGTNEVKNEVVKSSVVLIQIPQGIDWGAGRTVRLVFGLAGKGDEHVKLLTGIARVLQDAGSVAKLGSARDKDEVVRILRNGAN